MADSLQETMRSIVKRMRDRTDRIAEETRERRLAEIRAKVEIEKERKLSDIRKVPAAEKIVWTGKVYELAELFRDLKEKGLIKASGKMNALEQACRHFVKPDGKQFNPQSLSHLLEQRDEKKRGFKKKQGS